MANEFGNLGAISQTSIRSASRKFEVSTSTDGAEWEVFYNDTWRDISSDFLWDTTRAGNIILRAIRWDDGGFRSYREDRDLILREKEKDDEDEFSDDDDDLFGGGRGSRGFDGAQAFKSFAKSSATAFGVTLASAGFDKILKPKLTNTVLGKVFSKQPTSAIGKFANANKIAIGLGVYNLFTNKEQSLKEKLIQTGTSIAISAAIKRAAGPASIVILPAIGLVESYFNQESTSQALGELGGDLFGRQLAKATVSKLPSRLTKYNTVERIDVGRGISIPASYNRTYTDLSGRTRTVKNAPVVGLELTRKQNREALASVATPAIDTVKGKFINKNASKSLNELSKVFRQQNTKGKFNNGNIFG